MPMGFVISPRHFSRRNESRSVTAAAMPHLIPSQLYSTMHHHRRAARSPQLREICHLAFWRKVVPLAIVCLVVSQFTLSTKINLPASPSTEDAPETTSGRRLDEFAGCPSFPRPQRPEKSKTSAGGSEDPKPCALLFFGLPKQFRDVVLPSIRENILEISDNGRCDIYLHTYNITRTINPRTGEFDNELDPTEVLSLTDNVVMDTTEQFLAKRDMKYYAGPNMKPYRSLGWDRTALENMYKQVSSTLS